MVKGNTSVRSRTVRVRVREQASQELEI